MCLARISRLNTPGNVRKACGVFPLANIGGGLERPFLRVSVNADKNPFNRFPACRVARGISENNNQ